MSRFLPLCCMLLPSLLAGPAGSQSPMGTGGVVYGTVHSGKSAPVASVLVALRRSGDTARVAGATTDSTGVFRISGLAPGSYLIELRRLGYRPVRRAGVTITAFSSSLDLGTIMMTPNPSTLDSVVVSSARPPISVLPGRNIYSTSSMPVAAGGAATDILRNIPELEVSEEGTVTTRGAAPQIHIDGRPAPMHGEALDRYLQQLPADRIDRIEVISNPSARHEADGEGGIVNIVMKRGTSLGVSGSVSVNAGTRNQRGGSGSINYQEGRLSLFGSGSATFVGNRSASSDLRQNLNAEPMTYIEQDSRTRNSGSSGNASLAAELKAGSQGTLWADLGVGRNRSDASVVAAYTHLDELRNPTQRYDRANETEVRGLFVSSSAGYRNVAAAGGGEWSLEVRRNANDDDQESESARHVLSAEGAAVASAPEITVAGQGQTQNSFSLSANVVRPWGRAGQIELGLRNSLRSTGDNFNMWFDPSRDPSATDNAAGSFRQRERVDAAFVNVTRQFGRLHLEAGVRGQRAEIRRSLPLTGDTFDLSYRNLFPSAIISTTVGETGQVSFSYSKRVDNPWGGILSPATPNLDPLNQRVGNPYLMPRYTHSFSLAVTRTGRLGMLQLSPYYRRTVNSWDQVRTVDQAGISTVTWQNLATISTLGGSVSASLSPVGRVGGFLNISGYREVRDASNLSTDFSGSSTQISMISTASIRATSAMTIQGSLTYLPARDLPQGRISPMVFSTLGVRHVLFGRRGSINLSVADPFELQQFRFTTRDQAHVQTGRSTFSARRATLGITYNLGRPPQRSIRNTPEEGQQENQPPVIR